MASPTAGGIMPPARDIRCKKVLPTPSTISKTAQPIMCAHTGEQCKIQFMIFSILVQSKPSPYLNASVLLLSKYGAHKEVDSRWMEIQQAAWEEMEATLLEQCRLAVRPPCTSLSAGRVKLHVLNPQQQLLVDGTVAEQLMVPIVATLHAAVVVPPISA